MSTKSILLTVVAVLVFGVFIWLLVAEKGRTSDLDTQLRNLQRSSQSEISRLESQATASKRDLDRANSNIKTMESDLATSRRRASELESSAQSAERQLTAAKTEADTLREELNKVRQESETLKAETEKFRAEAERLKAESDSLKAASDSLKTESEGLKTETESARSEADRLKAEAEQLKKQAEDAKVESEKLKANEAAAQEKISSLSQREDILEKSLTVAVNRTKALEEERKTLKAALADGGQLPPATVTPVAAQECPSVPQAAETARLTEELNRSQAELETLRGQLAEGRAQLVSLSQSAPTASLSAAGGLSPEMCDKVTADLKGHIDNERLTVSQQNGQLSLTLMNNNLFSPGRATLSREGEKMLASVATALKTLDDKKIAVIGHTDDEPITQSRFASNWELSSARASAVTHYFQKAGLKPENLEAVGRAFFAPLVPNDSAENRRQNRRVEILISNPAATVLKAASITPEDAEPTVELVRNPVADGGLAQNVKIVQ